MKKSVIVNTLIVLFLFVFTNDVFATPVNKAFKDDVFYSIIINNLNDRNVFGINNRTVKHNVTDEELNTITYLRIDNKIKESVKNFEGLQKLKSLSSLVIEYQLSISKLDISENKELRYLRIVNANSLHDIDFSNNTKLSVIDLIYIDLNSLDLKNCTNLTNINITSGTDNGRLKYLDVSNSLELSKINISGHCLEEVDLSKNLNLREVQICSGNLKEIKLPKDSHISVLTLHGNNFKSLNNIMNIENQNNLKTLGLMRNQITDVDLISELPKDVEIYLDGNDQTIILNETKGSIELPAMFVEAIDENSIIYAKYGIDISTVGEVKATINGTKVKYSNAVLGDQIIVKINGNPEKNYIKNGISVTYEFLPKNNYFEDANLYKIIINDLNDRNVFGINDRDINYKVSKEELATVTKLSINGWQDDRNSVKINSMKGIENLKELETLEIKYQDIKELDISSNKKLKYVSIINANYLHDVDFSNNVELVSLDLSYTHLERLNLKNCSNLNTLIMGAGLVDERRLEYFDVSNCYNLKSINISGHLLEKIDLRNNINLKSVEITFGPLEEIILPESSNINNLDLEYSDENLKIVYEKSDVETIEQPEIKKEKPILKLLLSII